MTRKYVVYTAVSVMFGLAAFQVGFGQNGRTATRALLISNNSGPGYNQALAGMTMLGWNVEVAQWYQAIDRTAAELTSQFDVVWVLPPADERALQRLFTAGGAMESFVQSGGVVVSVGVADARQGLDIGVGGLDFIPAVNPGPTTIVEADHPFISGIPGTGRRLTPSDLDPNGTGGGAYLANPPAGATVINIAQNTAGTSVCEYTFGQGRAIISVLGLLEVVSAQNLLFYVNSIVAE